jgi:hypothetical protein
MRIVYTAESLSVGASELQLENIIAERHTSSQDGSVPTDHQAGRLCRGGVC